MNLRLILIAAVVAACASTPDTTHRISGDFDGDGRRDTAAFEENADGVLEVLVRRAAAPGETPALWGGDISSWPRFALRAAPPGRYATDCEAYNGCPPNVPPQITLTHDGVIIRGLEDRSTTLYYWDGAAFQNVSIRPQR